MPDDHDRYSSSPPLSGDNAFSDSPKTKISQSLIPHNMAGNISIVRRAPVLAAPAAALAVSCFSRKWHPAVRHENVAVDSLGFVQSPSPFSPTFQFSARREYKQLANGLLFFSGLDAASGAIRGALTCGQRSLHLGEGVLKAPWNAPFHGRGKRSGSVAMLSHSLAKQLSRVLKPSMVSLTRKSWKALQVRRTRGSPRAN